MTPPLREMDLAKVPVIDFDLDAHIKFITEEYFITSLDADLRTCIELLDSTEPDSVLNEFYRRTLARTTFALIEGLCALEIGRALDFSQEDVWKDAYTDAEKKRLREGKREKTTDTIKFALSLVGRGAEGILEIDFVTSSGWRQLNEAIKVRDRLMHPKSGEDVAVLDQEIEMVNEAREWFLKRFYERQQARERVTLASFRKFIRKSKARSDGSP